MTLDELDERISAVPGTVIQIEKGAKSVGAAELLALAGTLGVSVAWLFADPPPGIASKPGDRAGPPP